MKKWAFAFSPSHWVSPSLSPSHSLFFPLFRRTADWQDYLRKVLSKNVPEAQNPMADAEVAHFRLSVREKVHPPKRIKFIDVPIILLTFFFFLASSCLFLLLAFFFFFFFFFLLSFVSLFRF